MTQEDKNLLLKDLCARLPYGVKVKIPSIESPLTVLSINTNGVTWVTRDTGYPFEIDWENCKPYLFPLSSMTEEQKEELKNEISKQTEILLERMKNNDCGIDCGKYYFHSLLELEWCNKNNFDYRGLIPKDLAIDATGLNIY